MFKKIIIILFVSCFWLVNTSNIFAGSKDKAGKEEFYDQIELFSDVISVVQTDYVEETKAKDIIYGALKGLLSSLDPYSQFMDIETYKELQVETEGQFGGLGIEITIRDNLLTIITPLDGTPAQKAGLKAQDRIVRIDGEITRDISINEAVKKMRGEPGTTVTLTVMREGEDELKDYTITRDIIKIDSVRKAELIADKTGYIKLVDFSEKTKKDMDSALEKLTKEGMDSLILDLRNNPGGLLVSSVEVCSEFLPTGSLIVSTKGRDKSQDVEYRAAGKTTFKEIPLIVMINDGSASASEIVAGAIQDHKRGIILGTKSFGKGSVQTVIPLRDGSALRLTTAKYYTPSGRTIHEKGIIPDVLVETLSLEKKKTEPDKNADVFEKIEQKEEKDNKEEVNAIKEKIKKIKPIEKKDNLKKNLPKKDPQTKEEKAMKDLLDKDNQLKAAVDLMRGIKVYQDMEKNKTKK